MKQLEDGRTPSDYNIQKMSGSGALPSAAAVARRLGNVEAREEAVTLRESAVKMAEEQLRVRELNHVRLSGQLEQQRIALQAFERQLSERTTSLDSREAAFLLALQRLGLGVEGGGEGGSGKGCCKGGGLAQPVQPGMVGRRVRHRGSGSGHGSGGGSSGGGG